MRKIWIDSLQKEITFDQEVNAESVSWHLESLLKQMELLACSPSQTQAQYHDSPENVQRNEDKKLLTSAANTRLGEIITANATISSVAQTITNFTINQGDTQSIQEANNSNKRALMQFAALLDELNGSLKAPYESLKIVEDPPEVSTAITKKIEDLNKYLKSQRQKFKPAPCNEDKIEYRLTYEDINVLIADKKSKREINCYAIEGNNPTSIKDFLEQFCLNGESRAQLIYKIAQGEHWSSVDIQRDKDGQMSIFFFDAIGHKTNLTEITEFCRLHNIELTKSMGSLQKDYASCSIFSVDHAFHMSKITNLHELLKEKRKKEPNSNSTYSVDPLDLPPILVKNAQATAFIEQYREKNPEENNRINKKNQTLQSYSESHQITVGGGRQYPAPLLISNFDIERKLIKLKG